MAQGEVDLVLDRHGTFDPHEACRVLRPGGVLLSQQVGIHNDVEINEAFGVPLSDADALAPVEETFTVISHRLLLVARHR